MSVHYPRIRIQAENGFVVVREGLDITFYMRHRHDDIAPKVHLALEAYLRSVGADALGWYADDEGELQPLDIAGWELVWRQMRAPSSAAIQLFDASNTETRYRFEYWGRTLEDTPLFKKANIVSAVSFWLPTEFLEEHGPGHVRELALELAAHLPFCSGHAGLSFNGDLDLSGVAPHVSPYYFRYPGLDIPRMSWRSLHLGNRVVGPQWLTFLGQPVLGELGGAAALRSHLISPETTVQALEGDRAVVTLGPWPEAGDTERGDTLPAYRELARVLEPWLFREPNGSMAGIPRQDVPRWERRFLD
ncbi:DUF3396 domain-containing protein [Hyalangium versicolor]|uniref:DUF3396 domain-containing protein n=1 Tax=Hyalangium versicolor TaxID=2861190 RepID=UPI001CCCFB94|nr:DUF3396 domain-containing protein [Hyalangium versicolor]